MIAKGGTVVVKWNMYTLSDSNSPIDFAGQKLVGKFANGKSPDPRILQLS